MHIMVINPNTTSAMTDAMRKSCANRFSGDIRLTFTNPQSGVASIEGRAGGVAAAYHTLNLIEASKHDGIDAYIIACFDDTGVKAAREMTRAPVLGIGQSAMHAASVLGAKYAIVTSQQRSVNIIEENAVAYGMNKQCVAVTAVDLPVLDLHSATAYGELLTKSRKVIEDTHAECLILGCGGMTAWQQPLSTDLGIPVIDGVTTAVGFAESLVRNGLTTSKSVTYAYPR